MSLSEAITAIYSDVDFSDGTILLQNDSDGKGDYIKFWAHPTHSEPTEEQLTAVGWAK